MEVQEAPLNLSRRSATTISDQKPIKQENDLIEASVEQWSPPQNHTLLTSTPASPWCFPTLTVGYPQLAITPSVQSLQYQRAYLQLVGNLIRKSLRETEIHENRGFFTMVPTTLQNQDESMHPMLNTAKNTEHKEDDPMILETTASESTTKQRPKKSQSPGKPSFKCPQCGVSYPHRFELNRHIKVSHIRPHRCEHCGKGFGHKNYLQVHIETVHLGRKMHKCDLCGKYLSTGGNLSVHVRTIHMGEKKYKCSICSRTFGQQCNMKTHMKRHFCKQDDKRVGRMNSC